LHSKVVVTLRAVTGLILTMTAAFIVALLFSHSNLRMFVPLGFVFILIVLASRFGLIVSVLGSLVAATVFAYRLFPPLGAARIEETSARQSLGWMILAAVALSFLLFPPQGRPHHPHDDDLL
jgi:K+-sensing histidine kinase KdpD